MEQVGFVLSGMAEHPIEIVLVVGPGFLLGVLRQVLALEQGREAEVVQEDLEEVDPIPDGAWSISPFTEEGYVLQDIPASDPLNGDSRLTASRMASRVSTSGASSPVTSLRCFLAMASRVEESSVSL